MIISALKLILVILFSIITFTIISYILLGFYFGFCSPDEQIHPFTSESNNTIDNDIASEFATV